MRAAKTHFEQIPVETVRKIAIEFPPVNGAGNDSVSDETHDEITSPTQRWRKLAQQVQLERDPARMIKLVQQLIGEFDAEEIRKRSRSCKTEGL